MMSVRFLRRLSAACLTLSIAACGDSTGPQANLNDAQVGDMLDAMSSVASFGSLPGAPLAVVSVSQTVDCPNGGSATVSGSVNENPTAGTATVQITQGFSGCMATSSAGRVWTFDGDPNIVTNLSTSYNQTTGAFSITGTQVGGIKVSSDVGSGSCQINLTISLSGDATSVQGSLSGSACGHNIQQSMSVTQ